MSVYLGIDAGTTALKAALFDARGRLLALDRQEYRLETPRPNWVELDPEVYWAACCRAVQKVLAVSDLPAAEVASLAVSSQGETLIPVDEAGRPVRRALVWLDNRATAEAAEIGERLDPWEIYRATGQPEVTPTWPACKILWLQRNEPDAYAAARRFLLVSDYLLARLTGRYVTERSIQSSSLLLDIRDGSWWQPMLGLLGLEPDRLPDLRWPGEAVGELAGDAAEELGLSTATVAVTGALDQVAGALGAGNVAPGVVTEATGGALGIVATVAAPVFDPGRRVPCHVHAVRGAHCLMPWGQTAGMALRWFRDRFYGLDTQVALEAGLDPYEMMTAAAAAVPPGSDGLIVLPHLEGAASPEFNPAARGVFFGATLRHTRAHFTRAIMEAVAYMLKRNLDLVEELGSPVPEVRSIGGAARSGLWLQIKADVLQKPVGTVEVAEAALLGVALLAAAATGGYRSLADGAEGMVRLRERIEPDPTRAEVYRRGYERYLALYERLAPLFDQ